mmetsp:Transcript_30772/g.70571  ORF Transcript_30772/g.70571 Transcript_30772/m.70571 type:complete len:799 (+) Transcript_30772:85-2481(+)
MLIGISSVVVAALCLLCEGSHTSLHLPRHYGQRADHKALLSPRESYVELGVQARLPPKRRSRGASFGEAEEAEAEREVQAEEALEAEQQLLVSRAARAPAPAPASFVPSPSPMLGQAAGNGVMQDPAASGAAEGPTEPSKSSKENKLEKLARLQKEIARDTDSEALAEMLGGMKRDIFELQEDVSLLHKDLNNGVALEVDDPNHDLVYPLSTCVRCIIMLITQYFVVYTCLSCTIIFANLFHIASEHNHVEQALRAAGDTMFYAPMLCVLFLGSHLRALQITEGKGGPQAWSELAMEVCVWAVFAQTLLVLSIPMFTGEAVTLGKRGRALEWQMPTMESQAMARFLTLFRYLFMGALYMGISVVCLGAVLMDARSLGTDPVDLWDDPSTSASEFAPPLSAAMLCTMFLSFLFFITYLIHAALRTSLQLSGGLHLTECADGLDAMHTINEPRSLVAEWEKCLRLCTQTVDLAPMLCLLFLCVRLHALHLDEHGAKSPAWVEVCFYASVASLCVQAVAIVAERVAGGKCRLNPTIVEVSSADRRGMLPEEGGPGEAAAHEDVMDLPEAETGLQRMFLTVRYLALLIATMLAAAIVASLEYPNLFWHSVAAEKHADEPLPPTTSCVGILTALYFTAYLGLFTAQRMVVLAHTYAWPENVQKFSLRALSTFERALQAVKFCPMLCILFFAARMRALQISQQTGSPQCWTQTAMYVSTLAVCLQVSVVILSALTCGEVKVEEGQVFVPNPGVQHAVARAFVELLQFVTFLALYGGTIVVVAGVLTMRPDTARCEERGFMGLLS